MRLFDRFECGVLCDAVSAVMGGVGLVGNVVGGIVGNSAAKKAGQIQSDAANAAASDIKNTTASVNPQIGDAAKTAGDNAIAAGTAAGSGATAAAGTAAAGVNAATGQANSILNPYSDAGAAAAKTLAAGLAPGGDFNKAPTLKDLQMDPGQQWIQQQQQLAMGRSAAARGGAISGAAAKDLVNYETGAASTDYQNAFNRFETATQNRFNNLNAEQGVGVQTGEVQGSNLINSGRYAGDTGINAAQYAGNAGIGTSEFAGTAGMNAADLEAANTINAAKTAGDYTTGGAAARAAGIVGGTNALTAGISGGINSASQAYTNSNLMNLLKNPGVPSSLPMNVGAPGSGGPGASMWGWSPTP
jgi:hypothetical protein